MKKGTLGQGGRIRVPRPVLAGAAVLLLMLGAAALASARGSAMHSTGPLGRQWWLFAAAALIGGIVAVYKLRTRIAATDPDSAAQARLGRGVLVVVAVLTAALPFALFQLRTLPDGTGQTPACAQCVYLPPTSSAHPQDTAQAPHDAVPHQGSFKLPLALILTIVGIVLALLIATAIIAVIIRLRALAKAQPVIGGTPPPALGEEAQDESALGAAVLAGRSALEGEARAAIIACYAAMEESLTEAGVPRLESDSPSDLLARATRRGVVDGPAPRLLARLFREARFSTHPMDDSHLDQARGALDEILAQLTARQKAELAEAAAAAGAGAGAAGTRVSAQ